MKKLIIALSFFSLFQLSVKGQETVKTPAEKQADYTKMIRERSDKIVDKLNISKSEKANRVSGMVAAHYSNLNDIYSRRDDAKKNLKALAAPNKPSEEAIKKIEEKVAFSVDSLHPIFLKQLATQLNKKPSKYLDF